MFKRSQRLSRTREIVRVQRFGKTLRSELVSIKILPQPNKPSRATVIVAKSVSKLAVVRNRLKRQVRELLKPQLKRLLESDIVVTVRPPAKKATKEELSQTIQKLLTRYNPSHARKNR